jgi:cytochrome c
MASRKPFLLVVMLGVAVSAHAQSGTYGVGRTPTAEEIRAWDISISPTGEELPPGHGTVQEGAQLFVSKGCAGCHGATGYGGRAPVLVRPTSLPAPTPAMEGAVAPMAAHDHGGAPALLPMGGNVMGTNSPFATVLWDYISRGMPLHREGTLKPDEVYSLTAFLLNKNGVIPEDAVMDQQSLPKVKMPHPNDWVAPPDWKRNSPRLEGYPY